MILPVTLYGNPLLRKIAKPIDKNYNGLADLIENMFETMYQADGVGLAAPQVGLSIRLFVIDATPMSEEEPELANFKKVFINPQITDRQGEPWEMEEGCLSLPKINEKVSREEQVTITYRDPEWNEYTETYNGYAARVIMHEYDHLEGKLFIDHVSPLRRKLLRGKLNAIAKGKVSTAYRVKNSL